MGAVLQFAAALESITCCACGIEFAMPTATMRNRREDGKNFYCPNGHVQCFLETEVARLKKQLEQKERALNLEKETAEYLRKERDRIEARRRAAVGQLTKVKNRVGHGVCPCCGRTFQQLARHMTSKHPDYAKPAVGEVATQ